MRRIARECSGFFWGEPSKKSTMSSDAAYLIALASIQGIGPIGAISVAKRFKTPDELANAPSTELDEALGDRCADALRSQLHNGWQSLLAKSEGLVSDHITSGIRPIAITESDYPQLLRCIADPPPVLYAKGNVEILKLLDAVAVVG